MIQKYAKIFYFGASGRNQACLVAASMTSKIHMADANCALSIALAFGH